MKLLNYCQLVNDQKSKLFLSTPTGLILSASIFMAIFDNFSLFKALINIEPGFIFILLQIILIASIINLMLSLFAFKQIIKPFIITVLMIGASTAYFMDAYGVIIDSSMIQNVFETDTNEATELLTIKLFIYLLVLGVLPSYFVWRWTLVFKPLRKEIITRLTVIAITLLVIIIPTAVSYKHFSIIHRQHKQLRMLANPTYPIYSFIRYIAPQKPSGPVQAIGEDATHVQKSKKSIVVFVLGETARAKQFELNGYSRNTNPKLKNYPIINFNNTWSCGTSTAESVPCMFSLLERKDYNINKARAQESLLDVLKRAGVEVLWRDNNSDCKGACARVGSEDMRKLKDPILCAKSECFDEILLQRLQDYLDNLQQDAFIVLHQKGSHGPEYFKRSPDNMKVFTPECTNANIQDCEQQSIINAYDNTILYTDFFLSRVIDLLQKNSANYNTAMLFMSDHGESLGEKGVYLHGFPYMLAPEEQRHIPFIAWFSKELANDDRLNLECIKTNAGNEYSHDNIFHTVLGLFSVNTKIYKPELDVFNMCRTK